LRDEWCHSGATLLSVTKNAPATNTGANWAALPSVVTWNTSAKNLLPSNTRNKMVFYINVYKYTYTYICGYVGIKSMYADMYMCVQVYPTQNALRRALLPLGGIKYIY